MQYIGGDNKDRLAATVEEWLENQGQILDRKRYSYVIILKQNVIGGVIVYHDYTKHSISMDVHAPKCLTKTAIKIMFGYPFNDLKVKNLFGCIESTNEYSRDIFSRMGFKSVSAMRDFYADGKHRVIYRASKEDIRAKIPWAF